MTLIPPATDVARLDLPRPYLLFLGDVAEAGFAKTACGRRDWARRDWENEDFEEVPARANDREYGLSPYIQSRDIARVNRLVPRLKAGTVYVNPGPNPITSR